MKNFEALLGFLLLLTLGFCFAEAIGWGVLCIAVSAAIIYTGKGIQYILNRIFN